MEGAVYKPGQGYWVRMMSAIGLTLLVLMGAVWMWEILAPVRVGSLEPVYVQAGAVVLIFAVFGALGYYLLARKPKVVDFMIATEGEMKKVNWSSRREIIGSTWLVIAMTIFLALMCFVLDRAFSGFFMLINVLESSSS